MLYTQQQSPQSKEVRVDGWMDKKDLDTAWTGWRTSSSHDQLHTTILMPWTNMEIFTSLPFSDRNAVFTLSHWDLLLHLTWNLASRNEGVLHTQSPPQPPHFYCCWMLVLRVMLTNVWSHLCQSIYIVWNNRYVFLGEILALASQVFLPHHLFPVYQINKTLPGLFVC